MTLASTYSAFIDPMKEFRESLKAMQLQDPIKEFRESLKVMQLQDPIKEFRESLKVMQLQDPIKEFRESLKAMQLQDPMKEFRESLKVMQLQDPMRRIRESLEIFNTNTLISGWGQTASLSISLASLTEVVGVLSDERWEISSEDLDSLKLVEEDGIIFEGQAISNEYLSRLANELVSNEPSDATEGIGTKLDRIITGIDQLSDPIHKKLLQWIVYPFIVSLTISLVNPVADYYIKKHLTAIEKKAVVKDVSRCFASFTADAQSVARFKIVTVEMLNVRRGKSVKSPVVGALYLGDIVEVIERGRKWTLVEWCEADAKVSFRGWVFSRYIKSIR